MRTPYEGCGKNLKGGTDYDYEVHITYLHGGDDRV